MIYILSSALFSAAMISFLSSSVSERNGRAGMVEPGCWALFTGCFAPGQNSAFFLRGTILRGGVFPPNWCMAAYSTFVPTSAELAECLEVIDAANRPVSCRVFPPSLSALCDGFHGGRPSCSKFSSTASCIIPAISRIVGERSLDFLARRLRRFWIFLSSTVISIMEVL